MFLDTLGALMRSAQVKFRRPLPIARPCIDIYPGAPLPAIRPRRKLPTARPCIDIYPGAPLPAI